MESQWNKLQRYLVPFLLSPATSPSVGVDGLCIGGMVHAQISIVLQTVPKNALDMISGTDTLEHVTLADMCMLQGYCHDPPPQPMKRYTRCTNQGGVWSALARFGEYIPPQCYPARESTRRPSCRSQGIGHPLLPLPNRNYSPHCNCHDYNYCHRHDYW